MLLTQCLGDREGTALIAWNPVSISGRVLSWQRPDMSVKPFRLSYVLRAAVWFLQVWRKSKFAVHPKENQNFRLVQAPGTLPPQMARARPAYFSPFSGVLGLEHRNTDLLQDLVSSSWNLCSVWKFRGSSHYVGGNLWLVKMITYRVIQNSCLLCGSE